MNKESCRVGKGRGAALPFWNGLSYAVPTQSYVTGRFMTRGHGVREGISKAARHCARLCPPYGVRG